MKSKSLLIFLLGFSKMLLGQDSLTVETVQDSAFEAPQYSSVYDDVFMNKKETKWLFKVDFFGRSNPNNGNRSDGLIVSEYYNPRIKVDFEHKIVSHLTVNYSLGVLIKNNQFINDADNYFVGIEPRWYFNNLKKCSDSKSINTLNGNYVSLSGLYSINYFLQNPKDGFNGTSRLGNNQFQWSLTAFYGLQRRIFNNWYFDYQLGVSYGKENIIDSYQYFTLYNSYWLHNKFTLGLAFGGGKKSQTNACDLFRCFEEEKSLLKVDIRNIYKNRGSYQYTIAINPEYERKIGKSAFSINTGIGFNYGRRAFSNLDYGIKGTVEPRYYYNLKKRIAQGKSANNLSGAYFSVDMTGGFFTSIREGLYTTQNAYEFMRNETNGTFYTIEPKWGIQKRLFQNGFMDFSFSLCRFKKSFVTTDEKTQNGTITKTVINTPYQDGFQFFTANNIPNPNIYFKIGFAF